MPRRGYPTEFRRCALDLVAPGRKVVDVARDLRISDHTLYNWRRQERIDRGERPNSPPASEPSCSRPAGASVRSRPSSPSIGVRPSS